MIRLTRSVFPEKINPSDLRSAIPLCRAAELKELHDLCVDLIISDTFRTNMGTSRTFVLRRSIADEGYDIHRATMEYYLLGTDAWKQRRFFDVERLFQEAILFDTDAYPWRRQCDGR